MFEILTGTRIPFMRYRRYAYALSLAIILAGAVSVAIRGGFRMGVDFAGGVLVEYRFDRAIATDQVRQAVADAGWTEGEIQATEGGKAFLIRIPTPEERAAEQAAPSARILRAVQARVPGATGELLREEVVGPRVGRELKGRAFLAVLVSMAMILLYVAIRYEWRYGVGGIAALAHDIVVVLAVLSFANVEITIAVIAGLLTVAGYSINDKIVVFDRVRERKKGAAVRQADEAMVDVSLNQTLSRTIITGLCVILTLEALLFMGGKVIHDFALTILLGVLFGTYSSIFIASGLSLDLVMASERRRLAHETQVAKLKA
jgi:preprotein translocase subunit SecF